MRPRIAVFSTGGTIASTYDQEAGGFLPELGAEALIRTVPELDELAEIDAVQLANISSTFLTPTEVFGWTAKVREHLRRPEVVGAVVTHGTDTLEESAYCFDLVLDEQKPVVFTGAMRTSVERLTDGARNLLGAAQVALTPAATDLGVLVVMADEIHAAREVTKSDSAQLHSFISPNAGPLGTISRGWGRDEIEIRFRPASREHIDTDRIEPAVGYVKTVMGVDSTLIDAAVAAGSKGLVIEAFGGGEVTPFMAPGIERARESGVEVVAVTRCYRGRPLDLYAEVGEGRWLVEHVVRLAGTLTGPKARIKLMLGLGLGDPAALDKLFP